MNEIGDTDETRKRLAQTFRRVLYDREVSNGEFRLFHLLYHHCGPERCFPGIRTVCRELGSSPNAVSAWRDGLKAKGYLQFEIERRGKRTCLSLCDGEGNVLLPKKITPHAPAVTGNGNTSVTENSNGSVTGSGNLTKYQVLNKRKNRRFLTQSFIPQ